MWATQRLREYIQQIHTHVMDDALKAAVNRADFIFRTPICERKKAEKSRRPNLFCFTSNRFLLRGLV